MATKQFDLTGKVAIVTGGNGGIGLGMARGLAASGADIAIVARNEAKSDAAIAELQRHGVKAIAVTTDVTDQAAVARMVERVQRELGRIDILVNNAGITVRKPPHVLSIEEWNSIIQTNLTSAFVCSQAVYPAMKAAGGGKIINIGSIFGHDGYPGSAVYCGTKAAIALLTKSLALELRDRNIQVNAIAPGWIETPMNEHARATDTQYLRAIDERFGGSGGWMKPEELTGSAVFLASPDADSVTGTVLFVDRGWSAY